MPEVFEHAIWRMPEQTEHHAEFLDQMSERGWSFLQMVEDRENPEMPPLGYFRRPKPLATFDPSRRGLM